MAFPAIFLFFQTETGDMPHRTFLTFIWPSALAMLLFIALPVVSVGIQSLHIQHEQVVQTVKNCGPFGCKEVEIVNTCLLYTSPSPRD